VLVVSYTAQAGGAGRSLLDFLESLEPRPVLALPAGPVADWARSRGTTVITLLERPLELRESRASAARSLIAHGRDVRRLARELDPETVVAWGMRSAIAAAFALARSRARLVVRHGDLTPSPAVARVVRAACSRAALTICASRAIADDLGPAGRVEVVQPGVDLERFRAAAAPPGGPVLLLGAIVGWKRPGLALEALAVLPDARLRVVGEPLLEADHRLLDELRRRAQRPDLAGRVEFVGAAEDPVNELSAAACLLHCADAEPFGRVVAEALASGVPVVAPSAGGPAEVVDDSCGRLFRPGDAHDAARALAAVLGDRERLSTGARARAEATLGLEDTRRRYRELVPRDPPRPPSEISLVTVIHDSERELAALLASVDRHLPGAEVVVVDSGSSDGGPALARDRGAKLLELGENVGYGRAVNVGLAEATRSVTIVANPDLELVDGSLAELAAEAGRAPDRLLAPALLRADGTRQDSVHPLPSSAPELAASVLPPAALPRPARLAVEPWLAREPRRVGWAVGACLVARSGLLRRLGPFDPEIFLYGEDLDLCLRGAERGVETWFRPDARVLHHQGHATRRHGERFELLARQRREVVRRRLGAGRVWRDDLAQTVTFANRIALKRLLARPAEREHRQLAALRRARRGQGPRW